jgi:ribosomal protein S21
MQVLLRDGESFEQLLKRFRAGVARDGIISEFKRHQSFLSKSQRARAKTKKAARKRQSRMRRSA